MPPRQPWPLSRRWLLLFAAGLSSAVLLTRSSAAPDDLAPLHPSPSPVLTVTQPSPVVADAVEVPAGTEDARRTPLLSTAAALARYVFSGDEMPSSLQSLLPGREGVVVDAEEHDEEDPVALARALVRNEIRTLIFLLLLLAIAIALFALTWWLLGASVGDVVSTR